MGVHEVDGCDTLYRLKDMRKPSKKRKEPEGQLEQHGKEDDTEKQQQQPQQGDKF